MNRLEQISFQKAREKLGVLGAKTPKDQKRDGDPDPPGAGAREDSENPVQEVEVEEVPEVSDSPKHGNQKAVPKLEVVESKTVQKEVPGDQKEAPIQGT